MPPSSPSCPSTLVYNGGYPFLHYSELFSCFIFRALLFPFCTFFMSHFLHVALFFCCTLFIFSLLMLHFLHVAFFCCSTFLILHFSTLHSSVSHQFLAALFSAHNYLILYNCTFSCYTLCLLHFSLVANFHAALFACFTLLMLYSFHLDSLMLHFFMLCYLFFTLYCALLCCTFFLRYIPKSFTN